MPPDNDPTPDNNPIPPNDRNQRLRRAELNYERIMQQLQPQLEQLPHRQQIPPLPLDAAIVDEVTEYVRTLDLSVPDDCPSKIAIGGEFIDRAGLREGRVGYLKNLKRICFLYLYPGGKTISAIVITPRDGVDARLLGMAIFWGLLSNVPLSVVQTEPGTPADFFAICSFKLSKIIDIPALERFKIDYQLECDKASEQIRKNLRKVEQENAHLLARIEKSETKNQELQKKLQNAYENAYRWQVTAMLAITFFPIIVGVCHYFRL